MSLFKLSSIKIRTLIAASLLASVLALPIAAHAATIGVGVGTGKIHVTEKLKPSLTYNLSPIAVFNNGDVTSDYEFTVQYNEVQPERKPPSSWFRFSPQRFTLAPGKARTVAITLNPDNAAKPGKYFVYLEAHPLKKDVSGVTAINVAAATKLDFEIIPANIWMRIYYFLLAFWLEHKIAIIIVAAILLLTILILLIRKTLNIEIKRKPNAKAAAADAAESSPKPAAKKKKKKAKKTPAEDTSEES